MYYCKQVPPDIQESPVWDADIYDNIFVEGTTRYKSRNEKSETGQAYANAEECIKAASNKIYEHGIEDIREAQTIFVGVTQDTIPRSDGSKYSDAELLELADLLRYKYCGFDREYKWSLGSDKAAMARIMTLMNPGREYVSKTIYGSVQGEYNIIFYDAKEYSDQDIGLFECEYFNTGTEWMVYEDEPGKLENEPDYVCDHIYCHGFGTDATRDELARAIGVGPEEIALLEFERYEKIPVYKQA